MINKDEIVLKIEALKKEVRSWESVLRLLERQGLGERTGTGMRFYQLRPQVAIKILLQEGGAQTRDELMEKLDAGGLNIGKKRGRNNPRIAFEKMLGTATKPGTGALKQVGDLIGLPGWGPEMFLKPGSKNGLRKELAVEHTSSDGHV